MFLAPFIIRESFERWILGYYALILVPESIFQSIGTTDYGLSMIVGNTLIMLVVVIFVLMDLFKHQTVLTAQVREAHYFWVIPLMILAILIPYQIKGDQIVPSLSRQFINEAGVAYCFITPVIEGILIMHHRKVYKPTLHLVSFVGVIFAFWNMLTWFGLNLANWWMGVLHFPLLILSIMGLKLSSKKNWLTPYIDG